MSSRTPKPKYRDIIEKFTQEIVSGQVKPGQKLPSEAALVKKFNTSRITVGRALRELQLKGLVERVAGSGTYVRNDRSRPDTPRLFGLLIPDLGETEIFDPICHGIASAPETTDHALLWGHTDMRTDSKEEQCLRLCQQFIDRKVDGVFFAPLEFEAGADQTNRKALGALRAAKIPVVLLDRRPSVVAERSRVDLVGLNNRQAGYMATEHLVQMGCKRIGFLAYQGAEATIKARLAGYRDALRDHGMSDDTSSLLTQLPEEGVGFEAGSGTEMDGFVCVNDRVAGLFMHAFLSRGVRIPQDIRMVGIDDVAYASLLPVPLTTVRQPCDQIGQTAMRMMLERIDRPIISAREVLLDGELVIRRSCGSN